MQVQFDLEPALEEEEPSVLEYARSHGACVDYTTERLRISDVNLPSNDTFDRDIWDPSDASITNAISGLTKERLEVNMDAALLLKAIHSFQEAPAKDYLAAEKRKWMLSLKQELPVIRSDYQLDLLNFGSAAMPDFKNLRIPNEITNEENDEGFEWPSKYSAYPAQCDEQAKAEKLAVSRDVLVHLQTSIRDTYTPDDSESIKAETLNPYVPSSPANRLPLASDSSDSVFAEAKALERHIMAADLLERRSSDSSDSMLLDITYQPHFSPLFENRTLPILKRRAEDLKVEGPLTPPMFSTSPMKKLKSVSFAETLHEYIPHVPWDRNEFGDDNCSANVHFDQFFEHIEPLAEQARRKVENEQLSGADTTARVDVPDVDFSLPMAPWNEYSQRKGGNHRPDDTKLDAQMKFLLKMKREDFKTATSWHGISALERELPWGISTTKVSTVNLEEKLHGESEMNRILSEATTGNIATSSAQLWKREGLRILDEDDVEEELEPEPEEDEERRHMEVLVRKRKLEMEEEAAEKQRCTISQQSPRTQIQSPRERHESHHWGEGTPIQYAPPIARSKTFDPNRQRPQASVSQQKSLHVLNDTGDGLMFGSFSATTALHKFMETRGKPAEPVSAGMSKELPPDRVSRPRTHTLPVRSRESSAVAAQHSSAQLQSTVSTKEQPQISLPKLPDVPKTLAPCSFIVSSALLRQRSLMKQVEQLYPGAELMYRDYGLPHAPAKEADILLSPSTGLIFTSLQQVKQRALPGHPDRSPVEERMKALQLRYERLIFMVSEGLSRGMEQLGSSRPDDARDKEVLAQFESFAAQLEGEVLIKYIRGGERALACSTVAEMANYGLPHGSTDIGDVKPLPVETSWEVFLRRVGLNPFAAQVIVAQLKTPFDVQLPILSSSPASSGVPGAVSVFGLTAFLTMSEEKRIRFFQALMGGSRILRRVSMALDQEWVSAAHGFRM
ncbi:hypothetical protein EJ02DRAFT_413939 [Clathrospora elynae]|uniref:Uncharacterized protein n=1 Tax=Clathrospora elynae TaxID=706981 RepID=A0A6A5S797_9PLEO|nr:hypothetical protein EJ02DRAFT_413939 [Clathrospora elynae]